MPRSDAFRVSRFHPTSLGQQTTALSILILRCEFALTSLRQMSAQAALDTQRPVASISWVRGLQVRNNKRYAAAAAKGFAVEEVASNVKNDIGKIDIIVHSLANGPEVKKPLLETSRQARCSLYLHCHQMSTSACFLAGFGHAHANDCCSSMSKIPIGTQHVMQSGKSPLVMPVSVYAVGTSAECTCAVVSKHPD